jgi:hypothetical protein
MKLSKLIKAEERKMAGKSASKMLFLFGGREKENYE